MNEKDVLREVMKDRGLSQQALADLMGYKTQSGIGNILSGGSFRVDTFKRLLGAMGYKLIVKGEEEEWEIE